jgi:uncharacterized protein (DUF433 family)
MAAMEGRCAMTKQAIDWTGCALVEVVPDKVSGAPILKGTRLPVQTIVDNHDYGMTPSEIVEQFGVAEDQVRQILDYARSHARKAMRPRAPSAARP